LIQVNVADSFAGYAEARQTEEAKMSFVMPRPADIGDAVERALQASAAGIPVSVANLMPSLRWKLGGLDISDAVLEDRLRRRARELGVELID
jgi:hypothetical protein